MQGDMTAKDIDKKNDPKMGGIPPLIDLHLHAGWTDFDHADQEKRTEDEIKVRMARFLYAYREAGIIAARDAGGYEADLISGDITKVIINAGMFDQKNVNNAAFRDKVSASTAVWAKIFITGGVGTKKEETIVPRLCKDDFKALVRWLHGQGKKVMVHCYGGESLDWCIEEKVETVEHGVFMTRKQAAGMAENGVAYVPTAAIYRLLSDEPELFGIPESIRENACHAAEAHMNAVRYAREEGVLIGHGTDFYSDMAFIGHAYDELNTLMDMGLSFNEAVAAGTVNALKILGG